MFVKVVMIIGLIYDIYHKGGFNLWDVGLCYNIRCGMFLGGKLKKLP